MVTGKEKHIAYLPNVLSYQEILSFYKHFPPPILHLCGILSTQFKLRQIDLDWIHIPLPLSIPLGACPKPVKLN